MAENATQYEVVVNVEEQYSLWPSGKELPGGWALVGVSGDEDACLDHIAEIWTDMRPLSLRKALAGEPRGAAQ
ncbi:MAG TPA: MbtH family NRPS accessory protein [Streptomyces sp.]|nr:MbtH family NRPS accessory protein [Streptomyces sp.]